jgi:hypothetical protein
VIAMLDFLATQALVAAVNGHAAPLDRVQAVERLGQRAGQPLQLVELVAREQVAVRQPPALQRALQQLYALLLGRKVSECHRDSYNSPAQRMEADNSQSSGLLPLPNHQPPVKSCLARRLGFLRFLA